MTNSEQLLRIAEVSQFTSLAKSTINLWVAQGKFPKPITLSPTIKVWRSQQIMDWIEMLVVQSDQPANESVVIPD
jgi:prophage regulatory protein